MRSFYFVLAALGLAAVLSGCEKLVDKTDQQQGNLAQVEAGEKLFSDLCSDCHPRTGRGDYLKRIPATLLVRRTDNELVTWIRGVNQHREMPSFVDLSEQQLDQLLAYLNAEISR